MRCLDHEITVQDLLLVQDADMLEKVLCGQNPNELTLTLKYDIVNEIPNDDLDDYMDESIQFPEDLDESELMEMLTEVMSIMLFNKDEQFRKYSTSSGSYDDQKKKESSILKKRRKKTPDGKADQEDDKDNSEPVQKKRDVK